MSLKGYSKSEFTTPTNRYIKTVPLNEEPPTFEEPKIWNDLRIWDDQYVWGE